MGKQHETMPNEPQEAPVRSPQPEIQQPHDPNGLPVPQEAPVNDPTELPQQPSPQPEIKPENPGSFLNRTEGLI